MSYDQVLAERVRKILADEKITEKEQFGGLTFLFNDKIACGVMGDQLLVNVGVDDLEVILTHPLARASTAGGELTAGCVEIVPSGIARDVDLAGWVHNGLEFVKS